MRTLVLGDVHGGLRALEQVLDRAKFGQEDRLVCLGDVADGYPDTKECFELLTGIGHLDYIIGNHDWWFMDWWQTGRVADEWWIQGGRATVQSYMPNILSRYAAINVGHEVVPESHKKILREAALLIVDQRICDRRVLYVHAGWDPTLSVDLQDPDTLMWSRDLWLQALKERDGPNLTEFDEVFLGHTTTTHKLKSTVPVKRREIWNLDQDAGFEGKLTLMDVDTHEYWQSDLVQSLYPGYDHRRGR